MDVWPRKLFRPRFERWSRSNRTITGGASISGKLQRARTDGGGFWICEQSEIRLTDKQVMKAWMAWETIAGDGVTQFIVPVCARRFAPVPEGAGVLAFTNIPHDDGAFFDDDAGYAGNLILATAVGAHAVRATQLVVDMAVGAQLEGGEYFSIVHPTAGRRLYQVGRLVSIDGTENTVKVWPPLREALTGGEDIDFDHPGCTMTVADPQAFAAALELHRFASGAVTFVEAF